MPGVKGLLRNAGQIKVAAAAQSASSSVATERHPSHSQSNNSAATSMAYMTLCGKAMECAGIIGEAVGVSVFAGDALEIIQLLLGAMDKTGLQSSSAINSNDTITFDYILPACARIAKALGRHFEPYVPFVMVPLLDGANVDIQFSMEDVDGDDDGTFMHIFY
jgi:hypothetical protein